MSQKKSQCVTFEESVPYHPAGAIGVKENVELKIYNPSLSKKKGADSDLRKMSDF